MCLPDLSQYGWERNGRRLSCIGPTIQVLHVHVNRILQCTYVPACTGNYMF